MLIDWAAAGIVICGRIGTPFGVTMLPGRIHLKRTRARIGGFAVGLLNLEKSVPLNHHVERIAGLGERALRRI